MWFFLFFVIFVLFIFISALFKLPGLVLALMFLSFFYVVTSARSSRKYKKHRRKPIAENPYASIQLEPETYKKKSYRTKQEIPEPKIHKRKQFDFFKKPPKKNPSNFPLITMLHNHIVDFSHLADQLNHRPAIQWEITETATILRDVADYFESDPKNLKRSRSFIRHNLPDAVKLIETYANLANRPRFDFESPKVKEVEEAITRIRQSVNHFYNDLLDDDLMDLEIQLKSIESTIQQSYFTEEI